MSPEKTAIPDDLSQLSQRLEEWRKAHRPRTRLPETIWTAAIELAQRHGVHRTAKALRMDYMQLKRRLSAATHTQQPVPPAFLELLGSPATGPAECVVELESSHGRMRVAMKGVALDWTSLLHAWREAEG